MDRGSSLKRKPCPKENAGFFSLLTFAYLLKFIHKGRKKEIEERDLFNAMDSLQTKPLGDILENHWKKLKVKTEKVSIIKSLGSCYGKTLLMLALSQMAVKTIFLYTNPWALGKFVSYFEKDQTEITRDMAFYYAGVMLTITFLNGVWEQHFTLWKIELGLKMQGSLSSLLYRKALSLSQSKLAEISTGKIVTSIVKDVTALNGAFFYGIDLILEAFQIMLVCYMLYIRVGIGSIGGLSVMGLSMILQVACSRVTFLKRSGCNKKSDLRLQNTQEVLSSIRLIKMYRWESFFKERLAQVRNLELTNLQYIFIWKSISIILGTVSGKISMASVFGLYLYLGHTLNADIVYYIQQLFTKVSKSMIFVPLGIQSLAECMISLKRINIILNAEENNIIHENTTQISKPEINLMGVDVAIGEFKLLKNVDLKLTSGLNILIGPSGNGKSTLLKTILKEYYACKGRVIVEGSISYANQHPWLFPSSVKQNILFGQPLFEKKYRKIVDICGLTFDFNTFINGDETILTDCGANLSKGQQSRINLARALYRESDIYLLDDCLASLDIQIKNHVFDNAIKRYLAGKLCLLVTHSTQFVNQADNVIIMAENTIKYSGIPDGIPPELFHVIDENQKDDVDESIVENVEKVRDNEESDETSALLDKSMKNLKDNIYGEKKKVGRVNFSCYKNYFKYGGGVVMLICLVSLHLACEAANGAGDKFLSKWVNQQGSKPLNVTTNSSLQNATHSSVIIPSQIVQMTKTLNDTTTVFEITTEKLNSTSKSVLAVLETTTEKLSSQTSPISVDMFTLYVAAMVISTVFVVLRCFLTYYYTIKVSKNIHKSMISNILQGSMYFFDTHLIGNILTRFSMDLYIMDEFIPFIWVEGFRLIFLLPICLLLIASVNTTLAIISAVVTLIFYYLCDYVLSTTRSTQRLSNATLSPLIGHLNASLEGLTVIRAYGTQQILKDEFDKHQDLFISANHTREIAARIIGFYSHTIAFIFTSIVTFGLLYSHKVLLAGDVGLILSQSTMLCILLEWILLLWMMMENSMTSVERALEYTKLPQENQNGRELDQWPHEGGIKFQNVSLTYNSNGETVLKNLNFGIFPQEKIGIVGRTGAGKSSIIVALFKMYDFAGDIMIDNVNIRTLSLECLRTHLAIIPQDPVIFTGTLRTNIDPKDTISDDQVWKTLEVVNLKSFFKSLDENLAEKNLSIGQKQLICLARALTKKSKIVILDEATANMDEEMDLFIQNKIRELFQYCTVITVAHRLHTVRSCDRIIVMDKGEIVELDTPHNLLSNSDGLFYKMVHQNKGKGNESLNKKYV